MEVAAGDRLRASTPTPRCARSKGIEMSEIGTPQAGDDRAMDTDLVALLVRQHGDIRNLFDEVEASTGEARRDAFRRLVRLLAVHETAEEEVVHPFARRALPGGKGRRGPACRGTGSQGAAGRFGRPRHR